MIVWPLTSCQIFKGAFLRCIPSLPLWHHALHAWHHTASVTPHTVSVTPHTVYVTPHTASVTAHTVSVTSHTASGKPHTASVAWIRMTSPSQRSHNRNSCLLLYSLRHWHPASSIQLEKLRLCFGLRIFAYVQYAYLHMDTYNTRFCIRRISKWKCTLWWQSYFHAPTG
jgi:hypothetical protein